MILDLCSGTGCIPLLLCSLLKSSIHRLLLFGVDISPRAISLAKQNLEHNIKQLISEWSPNPKDSITFKHKDMLSAEWRDWIQNPSNNKFPKALQADVVISNPPYISNKGYWLSTSRSVRNYEPKLSLVPPSVDDSSVLPEDIFYPEILQTALITKAKVVLMEVADMQQALRVAYLAVQAEKWKTVEIWRDWPDGEPNVDELQEVEVLRKQIPIKGSGHGRSVVCWA